MSYIVKKYEFESEEQADTKISALEDKGHTFVKLGFLPITELQFDEDGNPIQQGEYSDKYSVDVLWSGLEQSPYGWKSYEISVEGNGVHTFSGYEYKG